MSHTVTNITLNSTNSRRVRFVCLVVLKGSLVSIDTSVQTGFTGQSSERDPWFSATSQYKGSVAYAHNRQQYGIITSTNLYFTSSFKMFLFTQFLEDISLFGEATYTPVLDFWWRLLSGFKAESCAALFALGGGICVAHVPWDSSLVQHLLTSWQPAW